MKTTLTTLLLALLALTASAQEKIILLNEGNWQSDNARLTYFEDGRIVSNKWFRDVNGYKIGDTPNDIIQINDNLIAIAVNWSNIVQFITPSGKAVAATEDVPNIRKLATDGRYVYVTSYAHECGAMTFTKGFVAKIDTETFKVVAATEVGYEPEGIACYDGHLFVANSGGYAFQEGHDYERTVSILDAATMRVVKTVDTGVINLYGKMSQSGKFLMISSPGDYYENPARSIVFDCRKALDGEAQCFQVLDFPATYSTATREGTFLCIGSSYSYLTGNYEFSHHTVNPSEVMASGGTSGVGEAFPGTVARDIEAFAQPYAFYMNPYTGYLYATDAAGYVSGGKMHQWDSNGRHLGEYGVYINPGHFLALPPDGKFTGIMEVAAPVSDGAFYDLTGRRVTDPLPGGIYIRDGRKIIKK